MEAINHMTTVGLDPTTVEQAGAIMARTLGLTWPRDRTEIVEYLNDYRDVLYNIYPDLKLFDNVFHCICVSSFPEKCGHPCSDSPCYQGFVLPEDVASAEAAWEYGYPLKIHSLTGPVAIEGAAPGDTLEIVIEAYAHHGFAWTSLIPGLGLLADDFAEHHLFIWKLEGGVTRSFPGVTLLIEYLGVQHLVLHEELAFLLGKFLHLNLHRGLLCW